MFGTILPRGERCLFIRLSIDIWPEGATPGFSVATEALRPLDTGGDVVTPFPVWPCDELLDVRDARVRRVDVLRTNITESF